MRKNVPEDLFENAAFLCEECQKLGYCKARARDFTHGHTPERKAPAPTPLPASSPPSFGRSLPAMSEREIRFWVPLSSGVATGSSGRILQKAHSLFHEEEYELSSYLYRDLLQSRNDYQEALVGLAAALYLMRQYDEAAVVAARITATEHTPYAERFLKSCEKAVVQRVVKKQRQGELMFAW